MSYSPVSTANQYVTETVPMWSFLTVTGLQPITSTFGPNDIGSVTIPSNILAYRLFGDVVANCAPSYHFLYQQTSATGMSTACVQVRNAPYGGGTAVLGGNISGTYVNMPAGGGGIVKMSPLSTTGVLTDRTLYFFQSGISATTGRLNAYLGILPILFSPTPLVPFSGVTRTLASAGSGLDQAVPSGAQYMAVKVWGGGGGGYWDNVNNQGTPGGGAAFMGATIPVQFGYSYDYWVGAGGAQMVFGAGVGGQLSAIRVFSGANTYAWVIAGGGGGGGIGDFFNSRNGGEGGVAASGAGGTSAGVIPALGGGGGTLSGPGAGGTGYSLTGSNGSAFSFIEVRNRSNGGSSSAGGGGGYYGGGGGGAGGYTDPDEYNVGGGGGGGSSYASGYLIASGANGSSNLAGNAGDVNYASSAGQGSANALGNGFAGRIFIRWS